MNVTAVQHKVKVVALYIYSGDEGTRLTTRKTVGFRAECETCPYKGPRREHPNLARADYKNHKADPVG